MHRIAAALTAIAGCVACTGCAGLSRSLPPLAAVGAAPLHQAAAIQPATSRWNTGDSAAIVAHSAVPAPMPSLNRPGAIPLENVAYRRTPGVNASTAVQRREIQPVGPLVPVTRPRRTANIKTRSRGPSPALRSAPLGPTSPSLVEPAKKSQPALSLGGYSPEAGPAMSMPPVETSAAPQEIRRLPPVEQSREPALFSPRRELPQPPIPLYPTTGLN